MLQIDKQFILSGNLQNEPNIKYAILGALLFDKLMEESSLCIRTDNDMSMPNVYRVDHSYGFEVVGFDTQNEFGVVDVYQNLMLINYDYGKFLEIKNSNPEHIFNIFDLEFKVQDGKIVGMPDDFYENMIAKETKHYQSIINAKLAELNSGRLQGCDSVALVVVNINHKNGVLNAQQVRKFYNECSSQFPRSFDELIYITYDAVYAYILSEKSAIYEISSKEMEHCRAVMRQILSGKY